MTSVAISNSEASHTSFPDNSTVNATSVASSPSSIPSSGSISHPQPIETNELHHNIVKFGGALGGSFGALILLIVLYYILRAHGYVSAFKRKARGTCE
ncbi:hypothetical protein ONZ45_g12849 [Pleurotus djamor]|nr:hypothetical protein ONZ45_g12849 [Pleurotus djamor]